MGSWDGSLRIKMEVGVREVDDDTFDHSTAHTSKLPHLRHGLCKRDETSVKDCNEPPNEGISGMWKLQELYNVDRGIEAERSPDRQKALRLNDPVGDTGLSLCSIVPASLCLELRQLLPSLVKRPSFAQCDGDGHNVALICHRAVFC